MVKTVSAEQFPALFFFLLLLLFLNKRDFLKSLFALYLTGRCPAAGGEEA